MTVHEVRKLPPGTHIMVNGVEHEIVNWFGKKLLHEPGTANYKEIREEYRYGTAMDDRTENPQSVRPGSPQFRPPARLAQRAERQHRESPEGQPGHGQTADRCGLSGKDA